MDHESRPPGSPLGYNAALEEFRDSEYPMLQDAIYLDHAGTTLYPRTLMERFAGEMTSNLFGNPHSASASSQLSTSRIDDVRLRALQFLGADPAGFDLVFVANATAGIKLVAEAYRAQPGGGFRFAYHLASHTSLVGVREEARSSVCLDDESFEEAVAGRDPFPDSGTQDAHIESAHPPPTTLFAYPAQSNMDGRRLPLSWASSLRQSRQQYAALGRSAVYTLVDAASLASTSSLDLSDPDSAPDFVVVSFYKIFGFPDLGALIVRRQAEPLFDCRRYFGGGTADIVVSAKEQWHVSKSAFLHERLEDGTLPIHSIIALDTAMSVFLHLFGSMDAVSLHTSCLASRLRDGLVSLTHRNGSPVCVVYSTTDGPTPGQLGRGPIVAFNLVSSQGSYVSLAEFEKLATLKKVHVRTGGLCNPGAVATALGLEPWEIRRNFAAGFRCGTENDVIAAKPTGVIRASVGAMSTVADVDRFLLFITEFFSDDSELPPAVIPGPGTEVTGEASDLFVHSLAVFPIKSCGAYMIPSGLDWQVAPEGLAWDREWCVLHRLSGQALSMKRYGQMARIRPVLDFGRGELVVRYHSEGEGMSGHQSREIAVPLSQNPALFRTETVFRAKSSRVCGEEVAAQIYESEEINSFFSDIIGVPCVLARFPPGGSGIGKRLSKARVQKHQLLPPFSRSPDPLAPPAVSRLLSVAPPSPPDSDVENGQGQVCHQQRILYSNESPILAINMASVGALNREIKDRGGTLEVPAATFRANVVLESRGSNNEETSAPYAEDGWRALRIGSPTREVSFAMLGACRRCQMVCVDQETGVRGEEPFVTLSKTRRFDGKVFFGTHMGLDLGRVAPARQATIRVGDPVQVDWVQGSD